MMEYSEIPQQDPLKYCVNNFYTPISRYHHDSLDIEGYGFLASINLSQDSDCLLFTSREQEAVGPFILENYLRILAAYTSLQQGGLFLHSAGIVVNDKVYLFIGRSGAGKTTLSRLALESDHTVLSDDANIVLPAEDGNFQAGPVPFAGELGQINTDFNRTCPVAGIFWLEQSHETTIMPVKEALQTARMLACCPVVNVDPFRLVQILTNIEALLYLVPLRVLHFDRNQPFSAIRELIEK